MEHLSFIEVVVADLPGRFHYHLPAEWDPVQMQPGVRVLVPFGRTERVAYFIRNIVKPDVPTTKAIHAVLDETSPLNPLFLKFLYWISDYYVEPLGSVIKMALPPGTDAVARKQISNRAKNNQDTHKASIVPIPRSRKMVVLTKPAKEILSAITLLQKRAPRQSDLLKRLLAEGDKIPLSSITPSCNTPLLGLIKKGLIHQVALPIISMHAKGFHIERPIALNSAQQQAVQTMLAALDHRRFAPFLLHGVTGSGKTEVYFEVVDAALRLGRGAILLVPEISLTPQLLARVHQRFGEAVAIFHSHLSNGERRHEWLRIKEGACHFAIGVRSAIFAPLEQLGVIIVDEEQDPSYKQEEGVHYHARDMALVRGMQSNAVVVLGSATPSLESFYNGQRGKYRTLSLPERIDQRPHPSVQIVDLRDKTIWIKPFLTQPLVIAIEKRLLVGEQVLLFINRRGFSASTLCTHCGYFPGCVSCSVRLTYHKRIKRLICHYCGYQSAPPTVCPQCQGAHFIYQGIGTEQVEETIRLMFPAARIARMDRDTMQKKAIYHKTLSTMDRGEIDILIGTQMIAKGHDFHKITLVGVLCADLSLYIPDFRASERTFQLITQISGRAGRGKTPGEVIVQTFQPEHEAILAAAKRQDRLFYDQELLLRQEGNYPPFCRLALILLTHLQEKVVEERVEAMAMAIKGMLSKCRLEKEITLLGPVASLRLRGQYRYQILLKWKEKNSITILLREVMRYWRTADKKGARMDMNMDPQNLL